MLSEGQNVGVVLQAGDEHIMLYKIDNVVVKLVKSMEHERESVSLECKRRESLLPLAVQLARWRGKIACLYDEPWWQAASDTHSC